MTIQDTALSLPLLPSIITGDSMVIVLIRNGTVTPYRINLSTLLPGPATASLLGTIRLTGDLGGTATAPTVPGLATRAPINNAALTGAPTAPTPPSGDNNTRLATTAWVRSHINSTGINTLSDVAITTPVIGQGLTWNGTNWVNATASGGGDLLALNNLNDVNNTQTALNNLIDGDNNIHTTGTIRWSTNIANIGGLPPANTYRGMFAAVNGAGGAYYSNGTEWLRLDTALLNDLNDVNTAGVTNGQVLAYQSGNWIPTTMAAGPVTTTDLPEGANLYHTNARVDARIGLAELSDLLDVSNTAATNGQYLAWDSATSNWAPTTPTSTFTSPLTTKGDLHTYSTTNARLPIGANGTFLVADSTTTTGLRWQAPADTDDITEGTTNLYYTDARVTTRFNTLIPTVAKGDLLVQGATVLSRLPVGSNDQVLLADSTTVTGLRWGAVNSGGGALTGLSDVAITNPAQGQVLTWNATTSRWNAANLSNQISLNRQTLTGALTLTLSSAGTQHLDPDGANRDVLLPLNPTVGTRFRILNLAPAFNILVKNPNTTATVLTLGNSSTSIQAEFTWDGVDWYSWEPA
ncbi:hypothetical protein AVV41_gp105 [Microcystis phage MaMV-DC]|uniref:Tail fiber protein n=1 Tax=Microcystis phage MaMV-DC TaxID=1357715 RepID=A0A075BUX7_9CAUD|nr:hypothetical protein AVV41_gp105 [Microcystis phage MaMV-DC]AGR48670.1 hypothetical protein MaMVDC_105 [Microcystis phage MaMV-DC]